MQDNEDAESYEPSDGLFTAKQTAELMRQYAYLKISVQEAGRHFDRFGDLENKVKNWENG